MAAAVGSTSATFCPRNGTTHDGTLVCYWSDSSDTRGTLSIIWLCLSTLCVCVWNAVHPGIPRPGVSWSRALRKRFWWLFVGLFMPEMLVLTALGEFRQAWALLVGVERSNEHGMRTQFPWWMNFLKSLRRSYQKSVLQVEGRFGMGAHQYFRRLRITTNRDIEEGTASIDLHVVAPPVNMPALPAPSLSSAHGSLPNPATHHIELSCINDDASGPLLAFLSLVRRTVLPDGLRPSHIFRACRSLLAYLT